MMKAHYNWKYTFLRSPVEEISERYKQKFGGSTSSAPIVAPPAVAPVVAPVVAAPVV